MRELLINDYIGCKRVDAMALGRLSNEIYTIIAFCGVEREATWPVGIVDLEELSGMLAARPLVRIL